MKILIVEDEGIIAMGLQRKLAKIGYDSDYVYTGEEAVEKASDYDAVILDIKLKGKMDGIQTGAEIGKRYNIPIAYLSGNTDAETIQKAMATNPTGYFTKPIKEEKLERLVVELCA